MWPVIHGAFVGFLLAIFIGATFFVLMDTSINRGFWHAFYLELGIFFSDLIIVFFLYFSTVELLEGVIKNYYFKLGGGLIFIGFGTYYLFKHYRLRAKKDKADKANFTKLFLNGIFVNLFNPSVPAFWIASMIYAVSHHKYEGSRLSVFFGSALVAMLACDIVKIYYASRLKRIVNPKFLKMLYIVTGIILIALGVKIAFIN